MPTFDEWAKDSCENSTRHSQVTSPVLQGLRSYRISVQDGDDSYGERCELAQGNASASDILRVGGKNVLYHTGDTFFIAFAVFLPTDYTFGCGQPNVNESCDGGLITQEKQLGSCGVPALGTSLVGTGSRSGSRGARSATPTTGSTRSSGPRWFSEGGSSSCG